MSLVILDGSHKSWILSCTLLGALAAGVYALDVWVFHPVLPGGGTRLGLWLGILGTLLLAFAGLLPLRKWYPLARIGSAQTWLRAHIWLSLLGSFLILLHSAFRWRGTLEQGLMLLLAGLVLSGVWGLVAQHLLTRQLTLRVPRETFYENVPQICRVLQFEGDVLISKLIDAPLDLTPDLAVATDERLKNRGVLGRDFEARLAKVYASTRPGKAAPAKPESGAAAADDRPIQPAAATEPPKIAPQSKPSDLPVSAAAGAEKPLSAAEKIALMRAKKPPATSAEAPAASVESPDITKPATVEAATKPLSAADKIALMRAGKAAAGASNSTPVAGDAPASQATIIAAAPIQTEPPRQKPLSAADKIALMRAKKASVESPVEAPAVAAAAPATADKAPASSGLSTKDKLALMRSGKQPAATEGAAATEVPRPTQTASAVARVASPPPMPATARILKPETLKPFANDLRTFFLERVRPFLDWRYNDERMGLTSDASSAMAFAHMKATLPLELHEPLAELESLCDERRQLASQARLYYWLHGWLVLVHIPAAAALLALTLAHVAASLYW